MHTKREIVCTGLPEAMLIKSTALTTTRMAPSRTALRGMRPVSVLSNLNIRRRDLNGAIPFFDTKSGLKFGRAAHTQIKIHLHRPPLQLVHPPLRLKMGKSTGKGAMAMAARTAARDSRLQEKSKKRRQEESDEEEEEKLEEEEEDDDESPSHSEVEKGAARGKKTEELRKQLRQEETTHEQLEEKIAELRRKNAKSNKTLAELNDSQYADDPQYVDEDQEDRQTKKRRKRTIKDQRALDAPSVMFCRRVW